MRASCFAVMVVVFITYFWICMEEKSSRNIKSLAVEFSQMTVKSPTRPSLAMPDDGLITSRQTNNLGLRGMAFVSLAR
jgi:hypothetical protein